MSDTKSAVYACIKLVNKLNVVARQLHEAQITTKGPIRKLQRWVKTRFFSHFNSWEGVLEQKTALVHLFSALVEQKHRK